jgi:hypothetical protein
LQNRYERVTLAFHTERRIASMKPKYSARLSLGLAVVLSAGCGGVATHPQSREPTSPPAPSFARPVSYETGRDPTSLAVADLNDDGKGDIVTVDSASVSVLLSRGRTFARKDYPAGGASAAIADVNHDGGPDIVVATERKTVSVPAEPRRREPSRQARLRDRGKADGTGARRSRR